MATPKYEREVRRQLSEWEHAEMEEAIGLAPEKNPVVPGAGGVRKARWRRQGKGKSGGVRVIYYYWVAGSKAYMLSVCAKSEQSDDMTARGQEGG